MSRSRGAPSLMDESEDQDGALDVSLLQDDDDDFDDDFDDI